MDSRLEGKTWILSRWWWETDVKPSAELLDALRVAVEEFLCYLRADDVQVGEGMDEGIRKIIVGTKV
jgi:hypothetical protein